MDKEMLAYTFSSKNKQISSGARDKVRDSKGLVRFLADGALGLSALDAHAPGRLPLSVLCNDTELIT